MSLKPGILCKLKKGVILDAQPGFVDTFNWIVDFIHHLKGQSPIVVDKDTSDRPVIKMDESSELTVLTGIEYDASTHELRVKRRKINAIIVSGSEEEDVNVFTAVPHSGI